MTDSGGLDASDSVTITVNNVNEAPALEDSLPTRYGTAGESIDWEVDLTGVLVDPDAGDANLLYTVKGDDGLLGANRQPIKLSLSYTYETDDDGNYETDGDGNYVVTGTITGDQAIREGTLASYQITVRATDGDGEYGEATFMVHVDDGNDAPLRAELTNLDGSDPDETGTVEATENMAGQELGRVAPVGDTDVNEDNHPHGRYKWTFAEHGDKFEVTGDGVLKLKDGVMLDREADYVNDGEITLEITGRDNQGDDKSGDDSHSIDLTVTVKVENVNEAPVAIEEVGDWWVTIDEDLDEDDVEKGDWLSFGIETDPAKPDTAFTDPDGDDLTYSIVSIVSREDNDILWLEIDEDTGALENKEEMKADPGHYDVTVRATDDDGLYDEISFTITVAESDEDDEDNDAPRIEVQLIDGGDYREGTGKKAVATVTVTDDDFGLAPHPYGVLANDGRPQLDPGDPNARYFELSDDYTEDGNSRTWTVYVNNLGGGVLGLDHEGEDDVEVTVQAWNPLGNGRYNDDYGDDEEISVEVKDRNERPELATITTTRVLFGRTITNTDIDEPDIGSELDGTYHANPIMRYFTKTVDQEEPEKITLYLNLWELWEDPDSGDDDDELTYKVDFGGEGSLKPEWINIVAQGKWEDVQLGKDGEEGTADDVTWEGQVPGDDPDFDMDDETYVAIIEIDRTAATGDTGQAEVGAIRMVVSDEDGEEAASNIRVDVTDENVDMPVDDDGNTGAVSISGTMREGRTLTARFDHTKDPDYAGTTDAPVLVVYTWSDGDGNELHKSVVEGGEDSSLRLTQDHVDKTITVSVQYYELADVDDTNSDVMDGEILPAQEGGEATGKSAVANSPSPGTAHFVLTTSGTVLIADVEITDEDGYDDTAVTYTWQESANGRSGWEDVTDPDKSDMMVDLGAGGGGGKYYRLVVTYTDEGGDSERILVIDKVKVGKLADPDDTTPDVTGSANVGGTLVVADDDGTVQWQRQVDPDSNDDEYWVDIDSGEGRNLVLTNHHAGETLRALVTQTDGNGAITSITATADQVIPGSDNTAPARLADAELERTIGEEDDDDGGEGGKGGERDSSGPTITNELIQIEGGLAGLFQDAEGDKLTFEVRRETTGSDGELDDGTYVYLDADAGTIRFVSDKTHGHDGDGSEGGGNVIEYTITADDGEYTAEAKVSLRINVKPTNSNTDTGVTELSVTFDEGTQDEQAQREVANLNVIDENDPEHDFGAYDWDKAVISDTRFDVVPDEDDASKAMLIIKAGEKFEATDPDLDEPLEITVTVKVTDKAGTFSQEFEVTVTFENSDRSNDEEEKEHEPTDVDGAPGLKDDSTDTDEDAGVPVPPDDDEDSSGKAMGNLGDDLTGLHVLEDDLLDSFVLAIDDIDVA